MVNQDCKANRYYDRLGTSLADVDKRIVDFISRALHYCSEEKSIVTLTLVDFEWDEEKRRTNILAHGFDFEDSWAIFEYPMLTGLDTREEYGEDRWIGIGLLKGIVVVIVFTERGEDTIRVISLRKALRHERTKFEQAIRDGLETS